MNMLRFLFPFTLLACGLITHANTNTGNDTDTTKLLLFTEGVLQTRITFPGNPMNEWLSAIDISKGNLQHQLATVLNAQKTEAYA